MFKGFAARKILLAQRWPLIGGVALRAENADGSLETECPQSYRKLSAGLSSAYDYHVVPIRPIAVRRVRAHDRPLHSFGVELGVTARSEQSESATFADR